MPNSNTEKKNTAILLIILISYFMIVLDISIMITAIPQIKNTLNVTPTSLTWIQSIYTLFFGGLLLLAARAGDVLGRKKLLNIGLAIFTLASFLIGIAPNAELIIIARALQGIGAAILAPSTLALLTNNFAEGPERNRAVAYYGSVAGIGTTVGLVLGGILADLISWRAGFFINLPIGAGLILASRKYIQESEKHIREFDFAGAITSILGAALFIYGIIQAAKTGWNHAITLGSLGMGLIFILIFIVIESKANEPIMPLRLFKHRVRTGAIISRFLYLAGAMGFWFYITQYLQIVLEMRPLQAGFAFLPATISNFVAALLVPKLSKKFGNELLLSTGFLIVIIGLFWLSRITATSNYMNDVAVPMILFGIGQGISFGPLTGFGLTDVKSHDAGAASGLINVFHQLGSSIGLAVLTVVYTSTNLNSTDPKEILTHKISNALFTGSIIITLALLVVVFLIVQTSKKRI